MAQALWAFVLLGACLWAATPAGAYSILHHFVGGASDGAGPYGSLILDGAGNLYGTTAEGGSVGCGTLGPCGTVFTLKTDGTGYTILHSFAGPPSSDGALPRGGLVLDAAGNLYGTTEAGGSGPCSSGCDTVFTLKTDGTGYTILHNFTGFSSDGAAPTPGWSLTPPATSTGPRSSVVVRQTWAPSSR